MENTDRNQKCGLAKKRWLASDDPGAKKEMDRIRDLCPTTRPEVRRKISERLKEIGHKPKIQGGNGRGLTVPQEKLLRLLGTSWIAEYVVPIGRKPGLPTHYKLDLADPMRKITIEVDGNSHYALVRQAQDKKKTIYLQNHGWIVLRFWNHQILSWIDSGMPRDDYISMTLALNGINLTASKGS